MNFEFSEEQQMLVDTVRSFVENELYPHEDMVEENPLDFENIKEKQDEDNDLHQS